MGRGKQRKADSTVLKVELFRKTLFNQILIIVNRSWELF